MFENNTMNQSFIGFIQSGKIFNSYGQQLGYTNDEYSKGYDFDDADWYYVLNMVYLDYYKSGRSDDTYIELAHDFLSDSDAPENKAKRYFLAMHH